MREPKEVSECPSFGRGRISLSGSTVLAPALDRTCLDRITDHAVACSVDGLAIGQDVNEPRAERHRQLKLGVEDQPGQVDQAGVLLDGKFLAVDVAVHHGAQGCRARRR